MQFACAHNDLQLFADSHDAFIDHAPIEFDLRAGRDIAAALCCGQHKIKTVWNFFNTTVDALQGCIFLPVLFNVFPETLMLEALYDFQSIF